MGIKFVRKANGLSTKQIDEQTSRSKKKYSIIKIEI